MTGASRGIGAAVARALAAEGFLVHVAARGLAACEEVAASIRESGGRAEALALDVADPESIRAAVARVVERAAECGEPLVLVNNAGIAVSAPLVPKRGERAGELCERHLRINFHGPRRLLEALLPGMRAAGWGRVVNVVSSAGLRGYAYVSAYCASKHALLGYTRAAARELAGGVLEGGDIEGGDIEVSAVCPHYVDTPMTEASAARIAEATGRTLEEARALLAAENPSGVLVTPEEVGAAVARLVRGGANGRIVELPGAGEVIMREEIGGAPERVQPEGWAMPSGYSNGVVAPSGSRILSVAGQVAWDAEKQLVGEGDFALQFGQALRNVVAVVEAAGGAAEGILSMTVFVTDKRLYLDRLRELGATWREVCGRVFPAMALVEVAGLIEPGAMVEIQATAAVP